MVPWYLTASVFYYQYDQPIISDALFDKICKRLNTEWKNISHPHKRYITKARLSEGSGFNIKFRKLPGRARGAILRMKYDLDNAIDI